ncbi:protein kinase [Streptomyces sp. NPDC006654]|uniref:serine/threonine-protein kinase n=1 Tax=Streptomyces sp. NPDC006654 TaxID=3156897 RepID=UPI0033F46295
MPRPDPVGRVIAGRYRLVRSVGAGGMGRVWLAHDTELACDVALKEIAVPAEVSEQELNARIARARGEARHSARLRSNPHVVTVYDTVVDGGLPWIVMEYVPGAKDLEAVVRESGPLSPDDTAELGLALLDALSAGHQLGILHRDVKPSNVLLTAPDPQGPHPVRVGRVLLTDYGISLQKDVGEPRLTTAAGFIGTPGFLAPERARGSEPTPASDLFSLGATLYFAVEGRSPFDRNSTVGTLAALLTDDPTPPSRAGSLAPVLLKLLAKDPAHRLSADDAASLLNQLTNEPTRTPTRTVTDLPRTIRQSSTPQAPPPPPQPKPSLGLPPRKTRRIITLTAAGTLIVGIGVWAAVRGFNEPHKPSPQASPGSVMPYGETVGLTKELHSGDCVNAVWATQKFKGLPNLGITNCTGDYAHDGQVLNTAPASTLNDAQKNGDSQCKMLLADIVNAMADARSYALPPSQQGWDNGLHNTACLIFNKAVQLGGNAGKFRKFGEYDGIDVSAIGDCWTSKQSGTVLAQCSTPHDGQTAGFVKTPDAMTYKTATTNLSTLCQNKYGTYVRGNYGVAGNITDKDSWKAGFRYVQCDLVDVNGKSLTSSVITAPPSTQPSPG